MGLYLLLLDAEHLLHALCMNANLRYFAYVEFTIHTWLTRRRIYHKPTLPVTHEKIKLTFAKSTNSQAELFSLMVLISYRLTHIRHMQKVLPYGHKYEKI